MTNWTPINSLTNWSLTPINSGCTNSGVAHQALEGVVACHCGPDPQSMPLGLSGCRIASGMTNWSLTPINSVASCKEPRPI